MTDREHERLLTSATDRFERKLSEEISGVRQEVAAVRQEVTSVRQEVASVRQEVASVRQEVTSVREDVSALRGEMIERDSGIRLETANLKVDMSEQFGAVRLDAETKHRELLKWALVFWVGQAASVAAIVSALN